MKCGIPASSALPPGVSSAGQICAVIAAMSAPSSGLKNSKGGGSAVAAARWACATAARKAGRLLAQPANNAAPPADRNRRLEKSAALIGVQSTFGGARRLEESLIASRTSQMAL